MKANLRAAGEGKRSLPEKYQLFLMLLPFLALVFVFSYLPLAGWRYAFYLYRPGFDLKDCQYVASKAYEPYFPAETMPVIWAEKDAAEENAQLRVIITDYVNQAMTRFITGDMNLDTEWDSYVKALDNMNLATYIKYFEDGYAAAQAK